MARADNAITVEGLRELRAALRKADGEMHKMLRAAQNDAAQIVVNRAKPKVPARSGRARNSIRTASTQTATRVKAGSKRAPYYAWLDFGGRVGRKKSVKRPFLKSGRYIFPAYSETKDKVEDMLVKRLTDVCKEGGLL